MPAPSCAPTPPRALEQIARVMALLGGAVLLGLVALTGLSVLGRGLATLAYSDGLAGAAPGLARALQASGIGPIPGDFELIEAGTAFAVFAFLPWCQLRGAHARVDLFAPAPGTRTGRALAALWEGLLAAFLVLVAWRLGVGTAGKIANGETTYLLQFPLWWAYGASLAGAVVAACVALWLAALRLFARHPGHAEPGA